MRLLSRYYVNRDTLFSFHRASEQFLSNLMSIYVSAHYKNTPNDLQMLSDAPVHSLFVLMAPVSDEQTSLPQVRMLNTKAWISPLLCSRWLGHFRYWRSFMYVWKVPSRRSTSATPWSMESAPPATSSHG